MSVGQFYRDDDAGAALIPPAGRLETLETLGLATRNCGGRVSPSGREAVIDTGAPVHGSSDCGHGSEDAATQHQRRARGVGGAGAAVGGGSGWFAGGVMERPPRPLVYALFCVFGVSSWLTINAAFIQLPVLAETLPEGWAIGSYLAVAIQVANVFPLAFMWYSGNPRSVCAARSRSASSVPTPGARRWRQPTTVQRAVRAVRDTVYNRAIAMILCVGIVSTLLTAFLWDSRVWGSSVLFLFLMFVNGGVDCASSVLYWPFAAQFRTPYIAALSVGEGLSGVASSVLGIVQSPGVHNRFSVTTYFATTAGLMGLSAVAFALLLTLKAAAQERRGRAGAAALAVAHDKPDCGSGGGAGSDECPHEATSGAASAGGAIDAPHSSPAQHTQVSSLVRNPGHRPRGGSWGAMATQASASSSSNGSSGAGAGDAIHSTGSRGHQQPHAGAVVACGHDQPLEVTTASPVIPRRTVAPRWEGAVEGPAPGLDHADVCVGGVDVGPSVRVPHPTTTAVVRSRGGTCCGFRASAVTLWLLKDQADALVILGWASCLENGIIMSVRTYATLPYAGGTQVLFWVGTLVTLVDPLAACLPTWPVLRMYRLRLLCLLFSTAGAAIVLLALSSPNPPLKDAAIGGPLVVALFVLARVLVSYTRAMCVVSLQRALLRSTTAAGGQAGARWAGVFIQGGALVGSVLMFAVVNGTHLFRTAPAS